MVRESTWSIIQYITAILLILFLGFHLIERIPGLSPLEATTYEESLEYEKVSKAYDSYGWVLATLLVIGLFHGLNGLRGMLLEWKPEARTVINILILIVFIVFAFVGFTTIYNHLAG